MPSKFWVAAVLVESGMSAKAAHVNRRAAMADEHANRNLLRNAGRNTVQTKFELQTGATGMAILRLISVSCPVLKKGTISWGDRCKL